MTNFNKQLSPKNHVDQIKSTPEFHAVMQGADLETMSDRERDQTVNRAVARSAFALANKYTSPGGYKSPEATRFQVISQLDEFYKAQIALNKLREQKSRGHHVSHDLKLPHLTKLAKFNHALKEMIDTDSSLKFDETLAFLSRMYAGSHKNENLEDFEQELYWVMNGMRHELGAEQIVGTLGYDYDLPTIDDDLGGADIIVYVDGSVVPLDIKSNMHLVHKVRAESRHPDQIVWSCLHDRDFHNGFRISPNLAAVRANEMEAQIRIAAASSTN